MYSKRFLLAILLAALALMVAACSSSQPAEPSRPAGAPPSGAESGAPASHQGWLSAKEAVQQAYAALNADWKENATLVFVARYSRYAGEECSPFNVEDDKGFSSDGRLEHWVVIFKAPPEAAEVAAVFCVRAGSGATMLKDHVTAFSGLPSFDRTGWVDSTEIPFRHPPVDLELRTNADLAGVDAELANYPVLWIAYTSEAHYDVYDAMTGRYIKSR